jgi:DNA-binding NarL/FixJ family response regulator
MKIRILVGDDHSIVRRGVRALLESQRGWKVCGEAATGHEAVEKAKRLKPDVIVLDIAMPVLNGLEATRRIRSSLPHAKVLILSMYETEQAVRDALDAGARAYVFKSDLDRDLLAAVDLLAQNKTFFTPRVSQIVVEGYLKGGTHAGKGRFTAEITQRQRQVVRLLAEGKTNKEVAAGLGISVKTAETHRTLIMRRLRLQSFSDLVRYAVREHIVEP